MIKRIPVFLYHGVRECLDDAIQDVRYSLPISSIESQIAWLRNEGYISLSLFDFSGPAPTSIIPEPRTCMRIRSPGDAGGSWEWTTKSPPNSPTTTTPCC